MSVRPYAIADVIRLTGLSRHVLHKWEQRHGVVSPERTNGGHRAYSEDDVNRLQRLRRLTRAGHPIGRLAELSEDQLAQLESRLASASASNDPQRPAAADRESLDGPVITGLLVGPALASFNDAMADRLRLSGWRLLLAPDLATGRAESLLDRSDVALVDAPVLSEAQAPELIEVRRSGLLAMAVIYEVGSRKVLERLSDAGIVCMRAPVSHDELADQLGAFRSRLTDNEPALEHIEADHAVPPPRFARTTLLDLTSLAPSLKCECPNHVARLLLEISAFENYSLECESIDAEARDLHTFLRSVSASARCQLEAALERVLAHDGITAASLDQTRRDKTV